MNEVGFIITAKNLQGPTTMEQQLLIGIDVILTVISVIVISATIFADM